MRSDARILLIDDEPADRGLAALVLGREFPEAELVEVDGAAAFARELGPSRPGLVVTELRLAWSDGAAVLATLRDKLPGVPVLVLTADDDAETAVAAMRQGCADYLIKSSKSYLRLPAAARRAVEAAAQEQAVTRDGPWLHALLDRAGIGVFRSTPDGSLLEANSAFLALVGASSLEEAVEVALPTLTFRSGGRGELVEQVDAQGRRESRVVAVERPDGSSIWLYLTEVLLLGVEGDLVVDVLAVDVTPLRRAHDRLRRRLRELESSNADLSRFASIAAHELKAPLRTVERYAQVLAEELPDKLDEEARRAMDFVEDGVRRMRALVEGLLRFSRIDAAGPKLGSCDCNEIVARTCRDLQPLLEETGAEVKSEKLPRVVADPSEIEQIFRNLISNAIRFRGQEPPEVVIRSQQADGEWVFSVRDNGIGIDPEQAQGIFELFKRLHPEVSGTGIGLAICRRLVERHGGRIWVESAIGEGASFYFTLPAGPEAAGDEPPVPSARWSRE